jgi:hypothetical protein
MAKRLCDLRRQESMWSSIEPARTSLAATGAWRTAHTQIASIADSGPGITTKFARANSVALATAAAARARSPAAAVPAGSFCNSRPLWILMFPVIRPRARGISSEDTKRAGERTSLDAASHVWS